LTSFSEEKKLHSVKILYYGRLKYSLMFIFIYISWKICASKTYFLLSVIVLFTISFNIIKGLVFPILSSINFYIKILTKFWVLDSQLLMSLTSTIQNSTDMGSCLQYPTQVLWLYLSGLSTPISLDSYDTAEKFVESDD